MQHRVARRNHFARPAVRERLGVGRSRRVRLPCQLPSRPVGHHAARAGDNRHQRHVVIRL
eukprot:365425-Chlamydomonas_euryale.AAC.9